MRIILGMEKEVSLFPALCRRCGGFYNLAYDFEISIDRDSREVLMKIPRGNKIALCWKCRDGF